MIKVTKEDWGYEYWCPECESPIDTEWNYCPFCGKSLEWEDSPNTHYDYLVAKGEEERERE